MQIISKKENFMDKVINLKMWHIPKIVDWLIPLFKLIYPTYQCACNLKKEKANKCTS